MLCWLAGDVLRMYAGDFKPGEFEGKPMTQGMLMVMATIMLIPIVMVFLSLTLDYSVNRWINIIVAVLLFLFNLLSLRSYPGAYDKFLLIVGLGINVLTVWYAWNWV
jgi:hypothetical protein